MKRVFLILNVVGLTHLQVSAQNLEPSFKNPPATARPGVYWYFLDGNQDRDEMVADLRAMQRVGIGSVLFLEVDLRAPRGPVPFMSETWQDNVAHSFVEAGKLGMEVILGTGPGWSGSGGSWVDASDSMQHLTGISVDVAGPAKFDEVLPVPPPHKPNKYAGLSTTLTAARDKWFRDVAVIAFPKPAGEVASIDLVDLKTLKDVQADTIRRGENRYIMPQAEYPATDMSQVLDPTRAVDLTRQLDSDGRLRWDIPAGKWTILRFVARNTGQTTRPAPLSGHGFECNTFDGGSFSRHWDHYQQKLIERVIREGGPLQKDKGLTTIHLDSWEMSSQNWTADFREEFQRRRGYDPQPFYPAWMGMVVGDRERTERFLWDMRKTSQELVLEEYAGTIKRIAHEHGLHYSNEPYGMNPSGDLDLGALADIPMCEFWNDKNDTQYSCVEAASIAHTMGRPVVKAEAFTGRPPFNKTPANMKNQTDWALGIGINGFMFHTFQHQPLGSEAMPGMTFGPYGIHWNRNQTFWDFLPAYHSYLARSSHLLRQGEAVADILYLTPEGAPHTFAAPPDAFEGASRIRDKRGYSFDAVSPRILAMRAKVEDGRITFPGGSSYRVLVLPDVPTMTPETLALIEKLVKSGAIVIGNPPVKSPSLVNYPDCDTAVASLAKTIWGATTPPARVTRIERGNGVVYWGGDLKAVTDLYPTYAATAAVLEGLGLAQDFTSPSGKLRYIHRRTEDCDLYFVSNRTDERIETEGIFRVAGLQPQLWDPVTGETRALGQFRHQGELTHVPLTFEPYQSFFIIFPHSLSDLVKPDSAAENFPASTPVARLDGRWEVAFDPKRGGPEAISFETLMDWTTHPQEGIRYYSGIATYRKTFDMQSPDLGAAESLWLDLGTVHDICRVRLNGKDLGVVWTAPWRVDATGLLRPTANQIEIEVANTWNNRLVGDQQPGNTGVRELSWSSGLLGGKVFPVGRYTFVWHKYHKADSPLMPSGLLGPVTIQLTTHAP